MQDIEYEPVEFEKLVNEGLDILVEENQRKAAQKAAGKPQAARGILALKSSPPEAGQRGTPWYDVQHQSWKVRVADPRDLLDRRRSEPERKGPNPLDWIGNLAEPKRLVDVPAARLRMLEQLHEEAPNFGEVIDHVRTRLHACALAGSWAEFAPILLDGPPGVGKTRFMRRLSEILGLEFHQISMAADPLKLTGLSAGWGTARPGEVARFFGRKLSANPLFMLDEIDKCGAMQSQDAHLPSIHELLLSLLEQETARNLTDEYLEFRLDASHISWVCTSNEVWRLPEPLLSRLTVFDIAAPDRSQMLAVAQSCYRDVREAEPFGELFSYRLPDAVAKRLAAQSPRVISRMLVTAMERHLWAECRNPGHRVEKGSLELAARYLPEIADARPAMGFV